MQAAAEALLDKLPDPLRKQVAEALAPPKTLAERVWEDRQDTVYPIHVELIADIIATADRLREPEVRERVLQIFKRHGLKGTLNATLAIEDITALLGGRHE